MKCPECARVEEIFKPAENIHQDKLRCKHCGTERIPTFFHSTSQIGKSADLTVSQLGLPAWDIVWARYGKEAIGMELSGDNPFNQASPLKTD